MKYIFFCILPGSHKRLYVTGVPNVVSENQGDAKRIETKDVDDVLERIRTELSAAWTEYPNFGNLTIWDGAKFDGITFAYEPVRS